MRHFALQVAQHFFADNLRDELPFRLIAQHIIRKQLRAFDGKFFKFFKQDVAVFAGLCGQRNHGVPCMCLRICGDDSQQILIFYGVNLIDDEHGRHPILLHALHQFLFCRTDVRHRIDNHRSNIHICYGIIDDFYHVIAQTGTRLVQTRRVLKDKLTVSLGHNTGDARARRLRLIGHNGNLCADQPIEQCRFADIRLAYNGNDGTLFYTHAYSPCFSTYFSN